MSWLSKTFGGHYRNPADSANQYLDKIPAAMSPYFQPYIDRGKTAGDKVEGEYGKMINDPGGLYDKLGSGYKESPGYQFKLHQALQAANNASASGGMLGTPMHQQQNMQIGNDMAGDDFEKYINHILGIYGGGVAGEQGFADKGFDASTRYGENLGSVLGAQGEFAYGGTAGENANRSSNWANLFKGIGAIGGGVAGGPLGTAAANYFFPTNKGA